MLTDSPESLLRRLDWTIVRRIDGLLQGDYRTLFRGFGLDLAELREYQVTDDVRHMDWNVTARTGTPYVRLHTEDREATAWFLIDLSPSVDFGTVRALKRDTMIECVTMLARLLTRHGNRIGALLYGGETERVLPPRGGRAQVLRLAREILGLPKAGRTQVTDLKGPLERTVGLVRRRSLLFVVSDFISMPGWDKPLGTLAQRHEVLAIRVHDPRETDLPDIGPVVLEDAETGEQMYIDTHDRGFRARFAEAAKKRTYELEVVFRSAGVDMLQLSTEDDMAREIVRFALLRKQRKRAPASFAAPGRLLPEAQSKERAPAGQSWVSTRG